MGVRFLLIASASSLVIASAALASPAIASPGDGVPPPADRIAATTATFNAIQAKIAAGTSLRLRGFPDGTAQSDIIDYGVNDLWKKGIDGAGVTVAYVVTNPDHPAAAVNAVRAIIEATQFGASEPAKAAAILSREANLDARDAKSYVNLWSQIYMARLEPDDVATLKVMAEIFRKSGTVEGTVPASLFNAVLYERAKR